MTDQGSVNSQILDSVADTVTIATGLAPSQSFGMLDTVMIETLGMAMYNAVSRQQGGSMVGSAAVTAACAKMLGTPLGTAPKPHAGPPHIHPLPTPPTPPRPWNPPVPPTPPPVDPAAIIDQATGAAMAAIGTIQGAMGTIQAEGQNAAADETLANASLQSIAVAAAGAEDPPVPVPPAPPPPRASAARKRRS